jgi:hypothetical protein
VSRVGEGPQPRWDSSCVTRGPSQSLTRLRASLPFGEALQAAHGHGTPSDMHPSCVVAWPLGFIKHREAQLPTIERAVAVARNALFTGVEDADQEQLPVIVRLERQAVIGGTVAHAAHHAEGQLGRGILR